MKSEDGDWIVYVVGRYGGNKSINDDWLNAGQDMDLLTNVHWMVAWLLLDNLRLSVPEGIREMDYK